MVCGSIGHGDIGDIRDFQSLLKKEGFNIIDHISAEGMDYSHTRDFRDKKDFSFKIVNHDLEYVKESDVLVVLANRPSFGTAIEMFVAKPPSPFGGVIAENCSCLQDKRVKSDRVVSERAKKGHQIIVG